MSPIAYDARSTALLFVDPYNDFLSEGGKVWPFVEKVAREVGLLDNLRTINKAVRNAGIRVVYVPHRRWQPGDYQCWCHPSPSQRKIMDGHHFAKGEWGGEWHPDFAPQSGDIVALEHWGSSGFANTDLDVQLKQHRVTHGCALAVSPIYYSPCYRRSQRRSLCHRRTGVSSPRSPSSVTPLDCFCLCRSPTVSSRARWRRGRSSRMQWR
jgi:Isochorismatase family